MHTLFNQLFKQGVFKPHSTAVIGHLKTGSGRAESYRLLDPWRRAIVARGPAPQFLERI